jgi:hypothetical protein
LLKEVEQRPGAEIVQMLSKMTEPVFRRAVGQGAELHLRAASSAGDTGGASRWGHVGLLWLEAALPRLARGARERALKVAL